MGKVLMLLLGAEDDTLREFAESSKSGRDGRVCHQASIKSA